jgi:peptidoglycan/LPS O-acetylase OafA/YrhL
VAIPAAEPLDNAQGRPENLSTSPGFCLAVGGNANAQQDSVSANVAADNSCRERSLMIASPAPKMHTLDAMRGIAAFVVAAFHAGLLNNNPQSPYLAVDFFFVLSGLIICYVYGDNFKSSLTFSSYWKYLKARFARVYPLHFITLVWCLICAIIIRSYADGLAPFFDQSFSPWSAIPSLFLIQSLGLYISAPLNSPSWSLSTEWWMYMIFPLLIPVLFKLKTVGKVIAFMAIAALFAFVKYYLSPLSFGGPPTLNVVTDYGFFRCMAGFLLGMFSFKIYDEGFGATIFKKDVTFLLFFIVVIVAMAIGAVDLFVVVIFPFIILSAACNATHIKKVLETKVLQRLGDWSFSIYMVHVPIMYIFWILDVKNDPKIYATFPPQSSMDVIDGIKYCVIMVVLTLVAAALTYKYVEGPCRKFLNARFK